jgi:hypothetical protein
MDQIVFNNLMKWGTWNMFHQVPSLSEIVFIEEIYFNMLHQTSLQLVLPPNSSHIPGGTSVNNYLGTI